VTVGSAHYLNKVMQAKESYIKNHNKNKRGRLMNLIIIFEVSIAIYTELILNYIICWIPQK
jgi:hypothetical protein